MTQTLRPVLLLAVLAILATVLGGAPDASAQATTEDITIPAIAFSLAGNVSVTYSAVQGALQSEEANVVRTAVYFTKPGLRVCFLRLWAHDNDGADVVARLVRKPVMTDGSGFGPPPETMATVSSS